ncbi:MAG: flavodoxin family protein [Clostridia bacterium]
MTDKKLKILGISGSPRNSATLFAVKQALQVVEELGIETDLLSMQGKKFSLCVDCGRCIKENSIECVAFQDGITGWATRFLEYDGYIIASPVYDVNISAQLQGFFNRMRSNWILLENNPHYYAKKCGGAIAVGGTRYGGQELVLNAINNYYLSLGIKAISGGPYAYVGAGVCSKDKGAEGVAEDLEGMESIKALAKSVGLAVLNSNK